jgi:hypothetical protein
MAPHGFFDWKAIKGQNASKPYAIAIEDGGPLGVGGTVQSEYRACSMRRPWRSGGPSDGQRGGLTQAYFSH